jgi:predicted esterase
MAEAKIDIAPAAARITFSSRTLFDYHLRSDSSPKRLFLLLHGYTETGKKIFNKIASVLPKDAAILAPNGPYPMPFKTPQGYKVGCSWYFYDPASTEYFIDMSVAVDFLENGLKQLGLLSIPKTIIGFSQGGYLAPIAGQKLGRVEQVIGIGCEYLTEEFPPGIQFPIDAIHGGKDEIVSPESAQVSHARLKEAGISGTFHLLPETPHAIDSAVLALIPKLIRI